MSVMHKQVILVIVITSVIRLILRAVFVILSESPLAIPLVCSALLSVPIMLHLLRQGGCSAVILYFLIEPFFSTIYWCCMLFVMNTNEMCSKLGNSICEDIDGKQLPFDYIRRPYPAFLILIVPGLLVDFAFHYIFRKPVTVEKVVPHIVVREFD